MVDLIRFFDAGGCTSAEVLMEKYGIGERSVQRWMFDIQRWVPLEQDGRTYRKVRFE
jgi:hypothetical protein